MGNGIFDRIKRDIRRQQYPFDWRQLATILVKELNIHEGLWRVMFEFERIGMNANVEMPNGVTYTPGAFLGISAFKLVQVEVEDPMCVDAAEVNPKPALGTVQ